MRPRRLTRQRALRHGRLALRRVTDGLNCSAGWRRVEEVEALQLFLSYDPERGRPGPEARATGIARSWSSARSALLALRPAAPVGRLGVEGRLDLELLRLPDRPLAPRRGRQPLCPPRPPSG
jgi:hypothetical protein